ncbi:MAG TPA: L-rhamnose/proton symporter RhaT [Terriglobia bacterium]|nr:L-rhamnose/proton symporter RhaT [Terriglobia bacterium]
MGAGVGFFLICLGGFMQGTFYVPMKYVSPWKWENIWLLYAFLALVALPVALAVITVPALADAMMFCSKRALMEVFVFGTGWGIGCVLSGLGVDRLGLAIGVSVLIGITAALGSLIPLVVNTPALVLEPKGLLVIASVATLLVGVILVAVAGKMRDRSRRETGQSGQKGSFAMGLAICILSGIFSSMLNLAFSFSNGVRDAVLMTGASQGGAQSVVWMVALGGGFIANFAYTFYLLHTKHTWSNFVMPKTWRFWIFGAGMAALWYFGMVFYGRGAGFMGQMGTVIGWPLFMASMIFFSSIWGFITGEWRNSSGAAKAMMVAGLAVLLVASGMLGATNSM